MKGSEDAFRIGVDFWQIAGDPDLGNLSTPGQQPVDFGIWQARDGTWQLWSCIRRTAEKGKTRLFHCWQASRLTDCNWEPLGIAMRADPQFGETEGGLQAPFVIEHRDEYFLFYGDWRHICLARSSDGKVFSRHLQISGSTGLFSEGEEANTRDAMVLSVNETFYLYYTANPGTVGADFVRVSHNLLDWSSSTKIAEGGEAGSGPYSAECPFVYFDGDKGLFYLFRTQKYGLDATTRVYCSEEPTYFGVNDDRCLIATIPYAAPEIVEFEGQIYFASLLPTLKGIQMTNVKWSK